MLAITLTAVSACDSLDNLLEVDLPGNITESAVFQPSQADLIVNGVVSNYECAFGSLTAQMGGFESVWWRTSGFYGNWGEYNEIRVNEGTCSGGGSNWYVALQSSRALAKEVSTHLDEWTVEEVPNKDDLQAIAATYAGLSTQYLGEVMCEVAYDLGPLMRPGESLLVAEEWFTRAIDHMSSTGDVSTESVTSMLQLAYLGRARVRLALGTAYAPEGEQAGYLAGAAADAANVEPGFQAMVTRDGTVSSRWNQFHRVHNELRRGTIADRVPDIRTEDPDDWVPFTGFRNLGFDDQGRAVVNRLPVVGGVAPDPRVDVFDRGILGQDGRTPVWAQRKYESLEDNMPMGRWAEAQLILAEIEGGQSAVDRINAVRDLYDGLPDLTGLTDPQEIQDAVIEERRRELFIESGTRHYADKLRYRDDWGWFPIPGAPAMPEFHAYGNASCVLMPLSEYQINPNASGDGTSLLGNS